MSTPLDAAEILDREFLEVRAKLLQVGATLDRLSRAANPVADDPRLGKIHQALDVLLADSDNRAEQIQLIFSRAYEPDWRSQYFAK